MAQQNYNPNARYDNGPAAAGSDRVSNQTTLLTSAAFGSNTGLATDGTLNYANSRTGFHAAGVPRNNVGPNAAGQQKSINGT